MKRIYLSLLLLLSLGFAYAEEPSFDSYEDSVFMEKAWRVLRVSDDGSELRKAYESVLFYACFDNNRLAPKACGYMGVCHKYGWYGKKDITIANNYFEKGAKKDDAICLDELGNSYLYGLGVEEDVNKAIELLIKAANYNPVSYGTLGEAYLKNKDTGNATSCLKKGVAAHYENAYYVLINFYLDSYRSEMAYAYLIQAMDDKQTGILKDVYGENAARFEVLMGMFYESGLPPVTKDIERAKYWFSQAANHGDDWAAQRLKQLK